ncbi:MAG: T9SS type A sorting domain-containing protein [Chitinophagaceae bacterium]|nr:T9SS type A sorting domain-containing protein [Chitinophagaceae bacterium]
MYNFTPLSKTIESVFFSGLFLIMTFSSIGQTTYYSDPTSSTVSIGDATGGTSIGWSTSASGPFGTVTLGNTTNVVIQTGSTVFLNKPTAGGLTLLDITFDGGTLVMNASSANSSGSILGTGTFNNGSTTARINMNGVGRVLNATISGSGGFTIGTNYSLAGNTTIGGRISLATGITLDLAGYDLTANDFAVTGTGKIKASGIETLTVANSVGGTNASTLVFDESTPGTTNKLNNLETRLGYGSTYTTYGLILNSSLVVNTLTLTSGTVRVGSKDLTVLNNFVGGSSTSYVTTDLPTPGASGAGNLITPAVTGGTRLFIPIGTITSTNSNTYDPIAVTPTNTSTFTIHLKNAGASASNYPNFIAAVQTTSKVAGREWNISSSSPSATLLEITPSFTPGTTSPVIGRYNSSLPGWEETSATRSGNTFSAMVYRFSQFSVGEATGFSNTLPVQLTQFTATPKTNSVAINWTTASEKDNAVFQIEHSVNGKDFKSVGSVNGSGSSAQTISYRFEHTAPTEGVNYYRLKQVDLDGQFAYSPIKTAIIGISSFVIKSNLVTNALDIITSTKAPVAFGIFSTTGQRMLNDFAQGEKLVDVSRLPAGLYFVKIADGQVARFVKQ